MAKPETTTTAPADKFVTLEPTARVELGLALPILAGTLKSAKRILAGLHAGSPDVERVETEHEELVALAVTVDGSEALRLPVRLRKTANVAFGLLRGRLDSLRQDEEALGATKAATSTAQRLARVQSILDDQLALDVDEAKA